MIRDVVLRSTSFYRHCNERGCKKSTLVARLIRDHLDSEDYGRQPSLPLNVRTV